LECHRRIYRKARKADGETQAIKDIIDTMQLVAGRFIKRIPQGSAVWVIRVA